MPVFSTDWTPPLQEVMSWLTQSLSSLWGQLEAAWRKWVIIATFTATSCDVAQLRHSRTFCPPSLCRKNLWKILWHREKRAVWLHGNRVHNNINEWLVSPRICQGYCHVNSVHVFLINWGQLNSLFTKSLYDIWNIDPLRSANHTSQNNAQNHQQCFLTVIKHFTLNSLWLAKLILKGSVDILG